jgi:hypothetical protein
MSNSTSGFKVRPAALEDVPVIAKDLLEEGIADFFRAGINPVLCMAADTLCSTTFFLISPDDKPAALFGVTDEGCVWMNMTHEVRRHPKAFIKWAREFVKTLGPVLWNRVDIQNNNLRKFLRLIGFKVINVVLCDTRNIYYVEFAKVNYGSI